MGNFDISMEGKAKSWALMSQIKGESALRQKDFASALGHLTRAIALSPPSDHAAMVGLVCRRAVALLYMKVTIGCLHSSLFELSHLWGTAKRKEASQSCE